MKYLSLFSGIEAASVAWHPLGWQPVAFAEIEPFPSAVLQHRFPSVPNWGDVTKFKEWPDVCVCNTGGGRDIAVGERMRMESRTDVHAEHLGQARGGDYCSDCGGLNEPIKLIVGGSPCQAFSVAGLRKGLDDPRGNLSLTYLAIVAKYLPEWIVWENVPGVLSSNGGRDFASFLGALDELGYGYAWRVLDAQYVRTPDYPRAVPQRRRRVFVVGNLRGWQRAAAVLFDSEGVCRNPPPRREKRQGSSAASTEGVGGEGGVGVAGTLKSRDYKGPDSDGLASDAAKIIPEVTHALTRSQKGATEDGTGRGTPIIPTTHAFKIRGGSEVETGEQGGTPGKKAGKGYLGADELAFTVASVQDQHIMYQEVVGTVCADDRKGVQNQTVAQDKLVIDKRTAQVDQNVSPTLKTDLSHDMGPCVVENPEVSATVTSKWAKQSGGPSGSELGCMVLADTEVYPINTMAVQGRPSDNGKMTFGIGGANDPCPTLSKTHSHAVAFDTLNHSVGDVAQTVKSPSGGANESVGTVLTRGVDLYNQELTNDVHCPLRTAGGHGAPAVLEDQATCYDHRRFDGRTDELEVSRTVTSKWGTGGGNVPLAFEPGSIARDAGPSDLSEISPTLRREMGDNQPAVVGSEDVVAPSLTAANNPSRSPQASEVTQQVEAVHTTSMAVRRLTPLECERLQGFPDNWTQIPWRKKEAEECPDGPRYKAIGNSMAVNVMQWIGLRIAMFEEIEKEL